MESVLLELSRMAPGKEYVTSVLSLSPHTSARRSKTNRPPQCNALFFKKKIKKKRDI